VRAELQAPGGVGLAHRRRQRRERAEGDDGADAAPGAAPSGRRSSRANAGSSPGAAITRTPSSAAGPPVAKAMNAASSARPASWSRSAKLRQNAAPAPSWLAPNSVQRTFPLSSCVRDKASPSAMTSGSPTARRAAAAAASPSGQAGLSRSNVADRPCGVPRSRRSSSPSTRSATRGSPGPSSCAHSYSVTSSASSLPAPSVHAPSARDGA
jgi:hypothetical protein